MMPFIFNLAANYIAPFSRELYYSRRNRQRNVIWFNPPFSKNVKTNIARSFLHLVDTHFPASHKLHKIFNRNTVKVSYSCMNNVRSIITNHNTRIIRNSQTQVTSADNCNWRNKEACPLQNKCMNKDIVYKATISTSNANDTKHYIGMISSTFKERYRNHIKSFTHKKYANETELSKHIWHLKQNKTDFTIKWSIIKKSISYTGGSKRCNLCLEEKLNILKEKDNCLLNKSSEIISACQHKNRFQVKLHLKGFSIVHLNIASLIKHIDQLRTILLDKACHILSINESRLSENVDDGFVKINGYDIFRADRNRAGGAVALYVKTAINANLRQNLVSDDLEVICLEIKRAKSKPFFVISWYRPPNSPAEIFDKFEIMLRKLEAEGKEYHIVGDLNCNLLDTEKNVHSRQLTDIMDIYQLEQITNRTNTNHN